MQTKYSAYGLWIFVKCNIKWCTEVLQVDIDITSDLSDEKNCKHRKGKVMGETL
jgi:hypothetical protein